MKEKINLLSKGIFEYGSPDIHVSEKQLKLEVVTGGCISGEFVMCYPPGIPILAPGELITKEIAEYILYAKEKGCSMQGTEDPAIEHLQVLV